MEILTNVGRIKDNLFLIPQKRFLEITKDINYTDSLIYFLACTILSIPIILLVGLITGTFMGTLFTLPLSFLIGIPLTYVFFGIQFLLLKLVGGKGTFLQSVQIFIYGETISSIFGGLPYLNLIFGLISLANIVLGSVEVHKISLFRAIIAIFVIPTIIFILLVLLSLSLAA